MVKPPLSIETFIAEAAAFSRIESDHDEPSIHGVTDGKAVGNYLEHKFVAHLLDTYSFIGGDVLPATPSV